MANTFIKTRKKMLAAGMPTEALEELRRTYCNSDCSDLKNLMIHPDPYVEGTFAIRITRQETKKREVTFDLLWNKGGYDEVEFETWPPVAEYNHLHLFI